MKMVEKMAETIRAASPLTPHPDVAAHMALEVLKAMREPTDAMVAAFLPYYHDNYRKGHEREDTSVVYVWQDMIDAAIREV